MPTAADAASAPAHTPRELCNAQLRRDTEALKGLEQRITELDVSISANELNSLRLAESLQALRSERAVLSRRLDVLAGEIQDLTRSSCPASICNEDVLRLIFAHQSRADDPRWRTLGTGMFNRERALAPFTVSAVCKAWRAAALGCPEIWTYIGIPNLCELSVDVQALHVDRVRLTLSRSGSMPLDALIQDIGGDIPAYTDILDCLYEHIDRWRRCEFFATIKYRHFHKYLRGSLPLLEELYVCAEPEDAPPSAPWAMASSRGYLDYCPTLRKVFLDFWMPFYLDSSWHFFKKVQRLDLQLHHAVPSPHSTLFWQLFSSLPALHTLNLTMYENLAIESPGETFQLPALRKLKLGGFATEIPARFPVSVCMASLEHLELQFHLGTPTRMADLVNFLSACASSLRTLHIHALDLAAADGAVLCRLNGVSKLVIEDCTINAGCMLALQDGLAALTVLQILGTAKTFPDEAAVEGFLDFVRSRCSPFDDAASSRAHFVDVEVDSPCGLSRRDELEIQQLLDW